MTAKIEFQNDISIITLDDSKANVFSQVMLESLYECFRFVSCIESFVEEIKDK